MQPKTSIELGINKAISTDLQLCLDLARKSSINLLIFKWIVPIPLIIVI